MLGIEKNSREQKAGIKIKKLAEWVDETEIEKYPEHKQLLEEYGVVKLYDNLYHRYSQVGHWSPDSIIQGRLDIGKALITACQSLQMVSKCINDEYCFGFYSKLKKIDERILQYGKEYLP